MVSFVSVKFLFFYVFLKSRASMHTHVHTKQLVFPPFCPSVLASVCSSLEPGILEMGLEGRNTPSLEPERLEGDWSQKCSRIEARTLSKPRILILNREYSF